MVVASDPAAFAIRYGSQILQNEYGSKWASVSGYTHHLGNSGDEVELDAPNGGVIQDFSYDGTWYPQCHGGGFSLTVRDPTQALSLWGSHSGWESSGAPGGTPGTAETTPIPLPGSVVVNEVLANPTTAGGDMIELLQHHRAARSASAAGGSATPPRT